MAEQIQLQMTPQIHNLVWHRMEAAKRLLKIVEPLTTTSKDECAVLCEATKRATALFESAHSLLEACSPEGVRDYNTTREVKLLAAEQAKASDDGEIANHELSASVA